MTEAEVYAELQRLGLRPVRRVPRKLRTFIKAQRRKTYWRTPTRFASKKASFHLNGYQTSGLVAMASVVLCLGILVVFSSEGSRNKLPKSPSSLSIASVLSRDEISSCDGSNLSSPVPSTTPQKVIRHALRPVRHSRTFAPTIAAIPSTVSVIPVTGGTMDVLEEPDHSQTSGGDTRGNTVEALDLSEIDLQMSTNTSAP